MKLLILAILLTTTAAIAGPAVPMQMLDKARLLPVVTHNLYPGQQPRPAPDLPGMTPLSLISDDPLSTEWLRQHRDALKSLHVTRPVVSVTTLARLNALRAITPVLTLLSVSANDMAKRLPISARPVLITNKGLEQRGSILSCVQRWNFTAPARPCRRQYGALSCRRRSCLFSFQAGC